jgi:nucleoside permease NupC
VIVKPVMGEWKDCCFQGTILAKKPISNKYVAARLTQRPKQDLTDETADFLSVP